MDRTPTLTQKFVAEMLGTSFLTWIGAGSITAAVFLLNGVRPALAEQRQLRLALVRQTLATRSTSIGWAAAGWSLSRWRRLAPSSCSWSSWERQWMAALLLVGLA